MQRFARNARLLSLCRCPSVLPPEKHSVLQGQFVTVEICGFASIAPSPRNSKLQSRQPSGRISRVTMKTFIKRTEAIRRILLLFDAMSDWDDVQTPLAISGLRVPLNHFTISEVIRKCACADTALRFFKWLDSKDDFEADVYVYNALIYRLGKALKLKEMDEIASHVIKNGKASAVVFTTIISSYRRVRDLDGAVSAWQTMLKLKIQPSASTYTVMMDTYAIMKMYQAAGECYFQLVNSSHAGPTIRTCSVLIYHLVEVGKLDAALEIFNNLAKVKLRPNRVTYAYLMTGYAKAGDIKMVLKLTKDFIVFGNSPYNLGESFRSVLEYLVKEGKIGDAIKVMETGWPDASTKEIQDFIAEFQRDHIGDASPRSMPCRVGLHGREFGFGTDDEAEEERDDEEEKITLSHFRGQDVTSMSKVLEEEGGEEGTMALFQSRGQDVTSISNVLAFVKCLCVWSSDTVRALDNANVQWDCHLVSEVLIRLKKIDSAWKFYCWVAKKPGYSHDRYTCTMMIRTLLKGRQFMRAKHLLHEAEKNNLNLPICTYTRILKACGLQKQPNIAIEVFEKLKASGRVPDEHCYRHYIHSLHRCGRYWRVASVCSEMRKAGFPLDRVMYSFLITGFVKAGKLSIAGRLTKQMRAAGFEPDVLMLSDLVKAFHATGKLDKAETVFKGMRQCGMVPAIWIYEVMAEVLSRLGKREEAHKLNRELETLVGHSKKVKSIQHQMFLHFHSVFVDSFKGNEKLQAMMAAG